MNKWIGISLGALVGVSHIGMIGLLATRSTNKLPNLNIPVTPYSSYVASVNEDGYKISYSANDPKVMTTTEDLVKPSGFLGASKTKTQVVRQYTMDGADITVGQYQPQQHGLIRLLREEKRQVTKPLPVSKQSVQQKTQDVWLALALVLLPLLLLVGFLLLAGWFLVG
tara:strand:- start:133 stop:636 length:504 start_codon:yes stop_codon:yes gene_type:complete